MRSFALAFILGALALQQRAALPELPFALLGLVPWLAVGLLARERRIARAILLALAGAAMGFGYAAWRAEERLAEALPVALEGQDIEVAGLVASLPQLTEKGTRFLFDVEEWPAALRASTPTALPTTISLAWYAERAKGSDAAAAPPKVTAGERWRFTVRLKRPRGLANPHTFDFEPFALERGIRATGYVRAKPLAQRVDARVDGWPYTLHRWRGEIRDAMYAHLGDARLRGVLAALAVVALDPWAVLSAGFWLSFGAVAAIFYVMALRTGHHGKLRGAVLEQLAVTVGMLPMLMALFQEVSLASPIANAFAIPLVSLVVG